MNDPEGWIKDPQGKWSFRFHRDPNSWGRHPYFFMDKGMAMTDGSPAMLKSRSYVPMQEAKVFWEELISLGWTIVEAQWGAEIDP